MQQANIWKLENGSSIKFADSDDVLWSYDNATFYDKLSDLLDREDMLVMGDVIYKASVTTHVLTEDDFSE